MKPRLFLVVALTLSMTLSLSTYSAHAKSYIAYISDSSNSSVVYWIAKEAGIFKKHGLEFERSLSTAACVEFRAFLLATSATPVRWVLPSSMPSSPVAISRLFKAR